MHHQAGKLIVIDGTDGSGKATQTKLLADKLRYAGFIVRIADFPQYGKKSAGPIEEYLNGKYGRSLEVGPYRGSILYAIDRYDASFRIREWLEAGMIVISNRYVTANLGHQGGKIGDPEKRRKYYNWLHELEYEIFGIPKPDLNIILHVDARIAQQLVDSKKDRNYLNGKKRDMHEGDLAHLRAAERTYLEIAGLFEEFKVIKCTRDKKIMSREEISYLLWQEVMKHLNGHINRPLDVHINHFNNIHSNIPQTRPRGRIVEERLLDPDIEIDETMNAGTTALSDSNTFEKLAVELLSPDAKMPTRAYSSDVGYDLYSRDYYSLPPGQRGIVKTGIKIELPSGFAGLIWDKSSLARDGVHVTAGVIDPGFRGEVSVALVNLSEDIYNIAPGQKIAQILFHRIELPELRETTIDDNTDRGAGEYGSSGQF
jgi:dTMP kinase